jgi:hypothetical protein
MNMKKTMGIAVILLVAFAAGVTAQSRQTASQIVSRWETMIGKFENLERETRTAKAFEKKNFEDRLWAIQRELNQLGDDNVRFLRDGGEFTQAQEQRMEVVGRRLQDVSMRIARNLENLTD